MKVGITGHQNLGKEKKWVYKSLDDCIKKYNVTKGYTCLAVGADQFYAELLRKNDIPYVAIIPSENYEKTFSTDKELNIYLELVEQAEEVIRLPFVSPEEISFYEAGKKIVDITDFIFAVWNGSKAKGLGGTGDIVEYAKQRRKKIVHINLIEHIINEIKYTHSTCKESN